MNISKSTCTFTSVHCVFLNYDVVLSLNVVLFITNSVDPDEMLHYAAFHVDPQCLQNYLFMGYQYKKS